jgi:hypothetical protein
VERQAQPSFSGKGEVLPGSDVVYAMIRRRALDANIGKAYTHLFRISSPTNGS